MPSDEEKASYDACYSDSKVRGTIPRMKQGIVTFVVVDLDCPCCEGALHLKYKVPNRPSLREIFQGASPQEREGMASSIEEVCPSCGYNTQRC